MQQAELEVIRQNFWKPAKSLQHELNSNCQGPVSPTHSEISSSNESELSEEEELNRDTFYIRESFRKFMSINKSVQIPKSILKKPSKDIHTYNSDKIDNATIIEKTNINNSEKENREMKASSDTLPPDEKCEHVPLQSHNINYGSCADSEETAKKSIHRGSKNKYAKEHKHVITNGIGSRRTDFAKNLDTFSPKGKRTNCKRNYNSEEISGSSSETTEDETWTVTVVEDEESSDYFEVRSARKCTVKSRAKDKTPVPTRRSKRISRAVSEMHDGDNDNLRTPPQTSGRRNQFVNSERTPRLVIRKTTKLSETPRSSKVNIRKVTPVLQTRLGTPCSPMTPRDKALIALHVSSAPTSLPCREEEFKTIYDFISRKIRGLSGGFMYIHGSTGIGKTATVHRVMNKLRDEASRKKLKQFAHAEINGMHLTRPKNAYCQIWKKLTGEKVSEKKAQRNLRRKFSSSGSTAKDEMNILIIDEFDFLCSKTQDVIYDIFEWLICSKLIIIAIANTKDLLEKMRNSKVGDRKALEDSCSLGFKPYSFQQLEEIIKDRLKGYNIFQPQAVELLARKAAHSGDARRALNLSRRVVSIAEELSADSSIDIHHVVQILKQIQSTPEVIFIRRNLSMQEKFLLRAIRDVLWNSGLSKSSFDGGIYDYYKTICTLESNSPILSEMELLKRVHNLNKYGLVKLSHNYVTINTEIGLSVDPDYIQMALQSKENN